MTRFSPEFAENLKGLVRHVGLDKQKNKDAEQRLLDARIEAEEKKKLRLYNLYAEEGIDLAALKKQTDEIAATIGDLHDLRNSGHLNLDRIMHEICEAIDFLRDTPRAALAAPAPDKAAILKEMVEHVELTPRGARHVWKKPYAFLMALEILNVREKAAAPEKLRNHGGQQPVTACLLEKKFAISCAGSTGASFGNCERKIFDSLRSLKFCPGEDLNFHEVAPTST